MISFTINIKVMSRVGTQRNETFDGGIKMQRRDTVLVETNGSKTSSSFEKVGNISSSS